MERTHPARLTSPPLGPALTGVVTKVQEVVEEVFAEVAALRQGAETLFERARRSGTEVVRDDLAELYPTLTTPVRTPGGPAKGAGFVAAPHALADAPWWLEWWIREPSGEPSRLIVDVDPDGEHFHDYTTLPWYRDPQRTGLRNVTGPYVDYLCTDEYTLTFTESVRDGGRFLGVVGSDVDVSRFEVTVLPSLRAVPGAATLINAHGRVIASNSPRRTGGSLVRDLDVAALWASDDPRLIPCGDFPIGLLLVP
ncbi:cache domain-containing protein [Cryptosporangium sp. NPDC051539]|uniref:cache domain-containing protein n=1 Tax=Cryptosporangium sp. NPDC051539 TaxID=3363962 RepID=UPI00378D7867